MFLLKHRKLEKIWTSSSMTAALCHDAYNAINQLFNLHTGAITKQIKLLITCFSRRLVKSLCFLVCFLKFSLILVFGHVIYQECLLT